MEIIWPLPKESSSTPIIHTLISAPLLSLQKKQLVYILKYIFNFSISFYNDLKIMKSKFEWKSYIS